MSIRILIDNFAGDPDELYNLVVEEIQGRALPDIEFNYAQENESMKTFFNKGDKAKSLRVKFKGKWIIVFGYRLGTCFFVSTRTTSEPRPDEPGYLHEVIMFCFSGVVDRATNPDFSPTLE